jgi:hypothetical protein
MPCGDPVGDGSRRCASYCWGKNGVKAAYS